MFRVELAHNQGCRVRHCLLRDCRKAKHYLHTVNSADSLPILYLMVRKVVRIKKNIYDVLLAVLWIGIVLMPIQIRLFVLMAIQIRIRILPQV